MQLSTFERQLQLFYHRLARQGYINPVACTSLSALDKRFRTEIQAILEAPRFTQKEVPIKDQWNIVSVPLYYCMHGRHVQFEFVFELHYHHLSLELRAIGIQQNGGLSQYLSYTQLPTVYTLLGTIEQRGLPGAKKDLDKVKGGCSVSTLLPGSSRRGINEIAGLNG